MTDEGFTFKRAPGERIEGEEYPVLWQGQEIGRGVCFYDDDGVFRFSPDEDLQKHLTEDFSVSTFDEFKVKVIELYQGK